MNVLLFANVGRAANGFYHAGDEAMFYESYRFYQKNYPKIKLTALVSSISHQKLNVKEEINFSWPENGFKARITFIYLCLKSFFWKVTGLPILTTDELVFVSIIKKQNVIHFTGGGNITSLFPNWLYYSFFIIFLGWLFKKEVILTSQTIGPIQSIDRLFSLLILNIPLLITLRENSIKKTLLKYGIFKPMIKGELDAAYNLPIYSTYKLPAKKTFRIGVSIHPWKNYEETLIRSVAQTLNKISKNKKIEVVFIPHIITNGNDEWDILYMKKLKALLENNIRVIEPMYGDIIGSAIEPAITIKFLTSATDLLITSRYHGIIFASSSNVPFLTFKMDEYYNIKNSKIIKILFKKIDQKYLINLNGEIKNISSEVFKKTNYIIKNIDKEKRKLKKINVKLKSQSNFLALDNLLSSKN